MKKFKIISVVCVLALVTAFIIPMVITDTPRTVRVTTTEIHTSASTSESETIVMTTTHVPSTTTAIPTTREVEVSTTIEPTTSEEVEENVKYNHRPEALQYAYDTDTVRSAMYGKSELVPNQKTCFLTFDDGIDGNSTGLLLDVLKNLDVPASFFLVGNSIHEGTQELLQRIYDEGHAIGGHTYNHNYKALYPNREVNPQEILRQHQQAAERINTLLRDPIRFNVFRYPGGHMSWKRMGPSDKLLREHGISWIDWNVENGDGMHLHGLDTQGQLAEIERTWKAMGHYNTVVLLMHDGVNKTRTREALPSIVDYFRKQDFQFGILN